MSATEQFLSRTDIFTDYEDFIFGLLELACRVGMPLSEFWEAEPSDTLIYIDNAQRQRQQDVYDIAFITGQMHAVTLANAFKGKGQSAIQYPTIYEVFGIEDPNKNKVDPLQKRIAQLRAQFAGSEKVGNNGSNR